MGWTYNDSCYGDFIMGLVKTYWYFLKLGFTKEASRIDFMVSFLCWIPLLCGVAALLEWVIKGAAMNHG